MDSVHLYCVCLFQKHFLNKYNKKKQKKTILQ